MDIIRTAYYIRGLELMKLISAVLDVSLTMGLTRCYKTEGFCTFIIIIIITRNSSGDEIANVNFLYDDIVHVPVLQNTIDSCIN